MRNFWRDDLFERNVGGGILYPHLPLDTEYRYHIMNFNVATIPWMNPTIIRSSFSFSVGFISFDMISKSSLPKNFVADCLPAQFKINNYGFNLLNPMLERIQEVSLREKRENNREIRRDGKYNFLDSQYIYIFLQTSDIPYISAVFGF